MDDHAVKTLRDRAQHARDSAARMLESALFSEKEAAVSRDLIRQHTEIAERCEAAAAELEKANG